MNRIGGGIAIRTFVLVIALFVSASSAEAQPKSEPHKVQKKTGDKIIVAKGPYALKALDSCNHGKFKFLSLVKTRSEPDKKQYTFSIYNFNDTKGDRLETVTTGRMTENLDLLFLNQINYKKGKQATSINLKRSLGNQEEIYISTTSSTNPAGKMDMARVTNKLIDANFTVNLLRSKMAQLKPQQIVTFSSYSSSDLIYFISESNFEYSRPDKISIFKAQAPLVHLEIQINEHGELIQYLAKLGDEVTCFVPSSVEDIKKLNLPLNPKFFNQTLEY